MALAARRQPSVTQGAGEFDAGTRPHRRIGQTRKESVFVPISPANAFAGQDQGHGCDVAGSRTSRHSPLFRVANGVWVASDAAIGNAAAPHPAAATFSPQAGRRGTPHRFPANRTDERRTRQPHMSLLPACGEKVPAGGRGAIQPRLRPIAATISQAAGCCRSLKNRADEAGMRQPRVSLLPACGEKAPGGG